MYSRWDQRVGPIKEKGLSIKYEHFDVVMVGKGKHVPYSPIIITAVLVRTPVQFMQPCAST